jgi:hypothetical protein
MGWCGLAALRGSSDGSAGAIPEYVIRQLDAQLHTLGTADTYGWMEPAHVSPEVVGMLATDMSWVQQGRPLVMIGDSGTGKSHLLIGIGTAVADAGLAVRYTTTAALVNEPRRGRGRQAPDLRPEPLLDPVPQRFRVDPEQVTDLPDDPGSSWRLPPLLGDHPNGALDQLLRVLPLRGHKRILPSFSARYRTRSGSPRPAPVCGR